MVFKGLCLNCTNTVHTVGQLLLRKPRKDKDVTSGLVGGRADGRSTACKVPVRGHEKVECREDWCKPTEPLSGG